MTDALFNEKYRPTEFEEVVGLDPELPKLVAAGNLPHLLFVGPAGTGKTTCAHIIVRKTGADVLLLNASKDRGIDTIREVIEPFALKRSDRLKIVFLDEFDATTPAFQTALRNFMEQHSASTRFIATCNYPTKIIDPLRSRFAEFKFQKYDAGAIQARLMVVAIAEGIDVEPEAYTMLIKKHRDDIRAMVNYLQRNKGKTIKAADIRNDATALRILAKCKEKKWLELRTELLQENLDYVQLITEMDETIFRIPSLSEDVKRNANRVLADYQYRMGQSVNQELCFAAMLGALQDVL